MKKRISKRVREEAILVLALCASNRAGTWKVAEATGLGKSKAVDRLVTEAFRAALPAWQKWLGPHRLPRPVYAEAEALLRTGWSPS